MDMVGILERRAAGEPLQSLAAELGLSWQRLWTLLYPPVAQEALPALRPDGQAGSLVERYRPTRLDAIWGQAQVVKVLRKFAGHPYPTAFVFEGGTGTGKTSAVLALAAELGCDLAQKEFGGVQVIASGEQNADAVRDAYRLMFNCPWAGSGWKVVIVNEADRMARPAETIWLDVLEAIPGKTVIIFTTNESGRLSQRFLDRCTRLAFESDAASLRASATAFASAIWKAETGKKCNLTWAEAMAAAAEADGQVSFRRVVQQVALMLAQGWGDTPASGKAGQP